MMEQIVGFIGGIFSLVNRLIKDPKTRLLIKGRQNELDIESFLFLTSIPGRIIFGVDDKTQVDGSCKTVKEYIIEFDKKLLDKPFIGDKKLKKYKNYVSLVKKYADRIYTSDQEKIFLEIKKEAEKLSSKVDPYTRLKCMQKLWEYEEQAFWEKTIFLISPMAVDKVHSDYLIYYSFDAGGFSAPEELRKIIQEHFSQEHKEEGSFYMNEENIDFSRVSPAHYELIERSNEVISIKLCGKRIDLYADKPYKLSIYLASQLTKSMYEAQTL